MPLSDGDDRSWCEKTRAFSRFFKDWLVGIMPGVMKSLLEVSVTIGFTFIPFIFLSIDWPNDQSPNTLSTLSDEFFKYWEAGEIVLPLFGLCGAVSALLALNKGYFSWWVHMPVGTIVLLFAMGGGAALIGSDGFKNAISPELVRWGFVGYILLVGLWFVLAAAVRLTEPKTRRSDQKARSVLDEANSRRNAAGSQT
jgi:hypothetical protein